MRNNSKILFVIFLSGIFLFSCSRIQEKFDKMFGSDPKSGENSKNEKTVTKEKTLNTGSSNDLMFFNKYIEVSNGISDKVENLNKAYYSEIPEPASLKSGSMIFDISFGVYTTILESTLKQYKRSLFDGGELAKLKTDNDAMKTTLEAELKNVLTRAIDLHDLCAEMDDYYKNKKYQTDLAKAKSYDVSYKEKYKLYDESYKALKKDMKDLKPVIKRRDPDDIKNADEKVIVVMQNGYEDILNSAEAVYADLEKMKAGGDTKDLKASFSDLEKTYNDFDKKIASSTFSDRTKYVKYSYEDYFSKMYISFSKNMSAFIAEIKAGKQTPKEFARKYDEVLSSYNNLITSYNSSINTINTFKVY